MPHSLKTTKAQKDTRGGTMGEAQDSLTATEASESASLGGPCGNEYCGQPSTHTLVNGDEVTHYCEPCLAEVAGAIVMENDHISFDWNDDHTVVTL